MIRDSFRAVILLAALLTLSATALLVQAEAAPATLPGVIFSCDFDKPDWFSEWGLTKTPKNTEYASSGGRSCLRVRIVKGEHYGTSFKYKFREHFGEEPEELFAAYDVFFKTIEGYAGKSPGFDGTYERAGWGGKPSDGTNGWSGRSGLNAREAGRCLYSYYVYSGQQKGQYGDNWRWRAEGETALSTGRWYRIEQYVKLNTPGKPNGILRAWVDGHLAFEKTDILFRRTEDLKIFSYWVDYYHGGKDVAPADFVLYLDNLHLSRSRIYPEGTATAQTIADWEAAARRRIEQVRQGDIRIRVVDSTGQPVPGARVSVKMQRHAFRWGTMVQPNLILGEGRDAERYQRYTEDLFNDVTQTIYWRHRWRHEEDKLAAEHLNAVLSGMGFTIRAHPVVYPRVRSLPDAVQGLSGPELDQAIRRHVVDISQCMDGRFADWDVVNEVLLNPDFITSAGGEASLFDWFRLAKANAPHNRAFINETHIIKVDRPEKQKAYHQIIRTLAEAGVVDGIGIQGHFDTRTPDPARIYEILDSYSSYNLPIRITEMDVHDTDDVQQARRFRDYLTVFFSHPSVTGVTLWGFWEGDMWEDRAALVRRDWTLKPSGEVWKELTQRAWWTDETLRTDGRGTCRLRGYLGEYSIRASVGDQDAQEALTLTRGGAPAILTLSP